MKRLFCLMLTLIMLCAAGIAGAENENLQILSCPEAGLSTKIPSGHTWVVDDGGVTVWLGDEGYVPNMWLYVRGNKLNDPVSYLHETFVDYMEKEYGENLVMTTKFEYYEIAGKKLYGVEFGYRGSSGSIIYQLNLVETAGDADFEYQARYTNSTRDMVLDALDTAITNFRADPDYYTASVPAAGGNTSAKAPASFKVTNIQQDGKTIGRCVAPEGFSVTSQAFCCTEAQSAGNPWLMAVMASNDEGIGMTYSSARNYYTEPGYDQSRDGQFHMRFMTPILHYMTAGEYCDYWAKRMNESATTIRLEMENNYAELQPRLDQLSETYRNLSNAQTSALGLTVTKVENTMCARCYYMETDSGLKYYFVVATSTRGVWNEARLDGPIVTQQGSYILWDSPCVYTLFCPAHLWESVGDIFPTFMENTSVTDQFLLANQRLSTELLSMMTGINLTGGEDYSRRVLQEEASRDSDYNEERYTDYMFDQNDYTLSDGSHVKISTQYDYVYEGDNGVVYYSDSAFAQPGGSTQLYPNR